MKHETEGNTSFSSSTACLGHIMNLIVVELDGLGRPDRSESRRRKKREGGGLGFQFSARPARQGNRGVRTYVWWSGDWRGEAQPRVRVGGRWCATWVRTCAILPAE